MTATRIPAGIAAVLFLDDQIASGPLAGIVGAARAALTAGGNAPTAEQRRAWALVPTDDKRRALIDQAKRAVPGGIEVEWTEAGATRWGTYTEKR